jgi:hypothetical protein
MLTLHIYLLPTRRVSKYTHRTVSCVVYEFVQSRPLTYTHTHTYYLGVRTVRVHQLGTNKHNKPSSLVSMYRHQTGAQNTELYPSNRYNNMMYCTYVGTSVRRVYTHTYMSTCCSQVLSRLERWLGLLEFVSVCLCGSTSGVCVCVCVCGVGA